jgi:hypothetical protein
MARSLALDPDENLPTNVVEANNPWRAFEADPLQVAE